MASSREENFTIEDLMKSAGNEPYLDSGLEALNDEEKMNNLLRELIEGSGDPSDHQPRDIFKPPPGYDVEGRRISVGSGGSTTSGGGDTYTDNQVLTPWDIAMMTPQEILTSNLRREQAKGRVGFWDPNDPSDKKRAKEAMIGVVKGLPGRIQEEVDPAGVFSASGIRKLVDWFGKWLVDNPPGGGSTTSGGGSDGGDGGGGAKLSPEEIKAFVGAITSGDISAPFNNPVRGAGWAEGEGMLSQSSSSDGGGGGGGGYGVPGQLDHRIFQPPSALQPNHPSLQTGMLTPAPGRDFSSLMDSGLDYLNPKEEPPSLANLEKTLGFPTGKEPELFGTFLKSLLGKGMFQDVEFKPWDLNLFEDRMNEAPLVERWAAQMKEEIGWQYMTPAERKDYIKKNKNNKNNHIIMDYNMYRRR